METRLGNIARLHLYKKEERKCEDMKGSFGLKQRTLCIWVTISQKQGDDSFDLRDRSWL